MILGKVAGTVVSSVKSDSIQGAKYLLVEKCNRQGKGKKEFLVALDIMAAGFGEVVLLSQGSSCRQTEITKMKPIDALVVGIVDLIDERGKVVFRK